MVHRSRTVGFGHFTPWHGREYWSGVVGHSVLERDLLAASTVVHRKVVRIALRSRRCKCTAEGHGWYPAVGLGKQDEQGSPVVLAGLQREGGGDGHVVGHCQLGAGVGEQPRSLRRAAAPQDAVAPGGPPPLLNALRAHTAVVYAPTFYSPRRADGRPEQIQVQMKDRSAQHQA